MNDERTALGGLVKIDKNGIRHVTADGMYAFTGLQLRQRIMLVTEPVVHKPVSKGRILVFKVLLPDGSRHQSNIFIGDNNKIEDVQSRILRCTISELRDPKEYSYLLNRLTGRVMYYSVKKEDDREYIRPVMNKESNRLDWFLKQFNNEQAA